MGRMFISFRTGGRSGTNEKVNYCVTHEYHSYVTYLGVLCYLFGSAMLPIGTTVDHFLTAFGVALCYP